MTASLLSTEDFKERLNSIAEARLADHRFGVSALAHEMEISRSTLHRKVKKVFHESASKYLSHKRLERARQLLLDKKISVTETASLCGFHSVTYFDKCFHDYFGYPPGETVNQILDTKKSGTQKKFEFLKKWFKVFK
jgi:transcriptional regulator GlxA family with amidase domain